METIKRFLVDSWRAKLVSLFIAISIWYLIRSHLEADRREFPVPGTAPAAAPGWPSWREGTSAWLKWAIP